MGFIIVLGLVMIIIFDFFFGMLIGKFLAVGHLDD